MFPYAIGTAMRRSIQATLLSSLLALAGVSVARAADVKTLVLYHLSIRYDRATALPK